MHLGERAQRHPLPELQAPGRQGRVVADRAGQRGRDRDDHVAGSEAPGGRRHGHAARVLGDCPDRRLDRHAIAELAREDQRDLARPTEVEVAIRPFAVRVGPHLEEQVQQRHLVQRAARGVEYPLVGDDEAAEAGADIAL